MPGPGAIHSIRAFSASLYNHRRPSGAGHETPAGYSPWQFNLCRFRRVSTKVHRSRGDHNGHPLVRGDRPRRAGSATIFATRAARRRGRQADRDAARLDLDPLVRCGPSRSRCGYHHQRHKLGPSGKSVSNGDLVRACVLDGARLGPGLDGLRQQPLDVFLADPLAPADERGRVDRRAVLEQGLAGEVPVAGGSGPAGDYRLVREPRSRPSSWCKFPDGLRS